MVAAALIGAAVGLVAGAGLGAIVMGLLANARVEAAAASEMQASRLAVEAIERADRYLAELDALVEETRPAGDTPDLSDVLSGRIRAAAEMSEMEAEAIRRRYLAKSDGQPTILPSTGETWRPGFDANPTVLLGPGETYEQWYAAYADRLDQWAPGWWDDLPKTCAPELARLAEERRHETYEQTELDHDRIPTRDGLADRTAPFGMAIYPRSNSWKD